MTSDIILSFSLYFGILLIIGLVAHRRHTTASDFMVGGRSLNFWVTAMSAHASDMSSWLFMAFPMALYTHGLSGAWIAVGLIVGMFCNWHFVAPKLRQLTEESDSYTLSSFWESRFKDQSGALRLISATLMLLFVTHYLAAGLISLGFLFESLFDMNYMIGISVATFVMLAYTSFGGFVAVAWVDFFQALFLLAMIILVPSVAYEKINGWWSIERCAAASNISLSLLPDGATTLLKSLTLALAWGLGYFGMPQILTKFMGINDTREIYKAKWLGMSWQVLSLGAAAAVGVIGIAFFCDRLDNPELVFVRMCQELFNPMLASFILCGVLAATISTMDSQILVVSAIITEDFYDKILRRKHSSSELLLVSRLSVGAVALVALYIASMRSATVYDSVFYAWSGLGCSFGPLMLFSLYSRSVNRYGAIAGVLAGGTVALLYPYCFPAWNQELPAMIPGFALSSLSIWLVSKLTPNR